MHVRPTSSKLHVYNIFASNIRALPGILQTHEISWAGLTVKLSILSNVTQELSPLLKHCYSYSITNVKSKTVQAL
jgi:hypothetical protein